MADDENNENATTADKIAANSVTTAKLTADAVTADKLTADSVQAGNRGVTISVACSPLSTRPARA